MKLSSNANLPLDRELRMGVSIFISQARDLEVRVGGTSAPAGSHSRAVLARYAELRTSFAHQHCMHMYEGSPDISHRFQVRACRRGGGMCSCARPRKRSGLPGYV